MAVCVLDDDPSVCRSLERLLRSARHEVRSFSSPSEFLQSAQVDEVECLVLDVSMPECSGLELQQDLAESGIPIVFVSGYSDLPSAVIAMRAGAVDFLAKPLDVDALLGAVERGIERHRSAQLDAGERQALARAYQSLTPREREVMARVVAGMLNKQIAFDLRISEKTVKVHRARVLEKMSAASLPDLVRMADRLGCG